MGCAMSKLEGEDLRPGLYSVQRKFMEVKRPPRRRLSIVSTTELLRSADADADGENGVEKLAAVEEVEELPKVEPEEEEKGRRLRQRVAEDEQLPGSPSFRFYFAGSTHADEPDDGFVIFQKEDAEKHKQSVDGSKQNQPLSSISKDSDRNQGKEQLVVGKAS